jgi:hypothetical protein
MIKVISNLESFEMPKPREEKIDPCFGYNTLVYMEGIIVEIKGSENKSIKLGETRSINYQALINLSGLRKAEIIGIAKPFSDAKISDNVIQVRAGGIETWIKPIYIS